MNWLDYLLIVLVAVSSVAGLMRGLLREVIALVTWITAVWLAWHYAGAGGAAPGRRAGQRGRAAPGRRAPSIFIVVLLVGTVIGCWSSTLVRLSLFSGTDRAFGGLFGLLRGLSWSACLSCCVTRVRLEGEPWWRGSLLVPYAEHAANVLRAMVGERKMLGCELGYGGALDVAKDADANHVRHRRDGRHQPRQSASLRCADGAAASRPGCRGHHDGVRRPAVLAQGRRPGARRVRAAAHARAGRQCRHRPRALSDRRLRQRLRGAALLRQCALRHLPGAQRQSDQRLRSWPRC